MLPGSRALLSTRRPHSPAIDQLRVGHNDDASATCHVSRNLCPLRVLLHRQYETWLRKVGVSEQQHNRRIEESHDETSDHDGRNLPVTV